jgi:TctA family transporter
MANTPTQRTTARALSVLALSAAMSFGYLIASLQAHDPRLDEAFQALQKAFALVEASQTGGGVPDQTQHQFDRHRERAMSLITRAMEEVVMAGEVADGGTAASH